MNQDRKQSAADGIQPLKLNVIIHGLWAIETNDLHIRLTTPDMGTEHVIKAGQVRDIAAGTPEVNLAKAGARTFTLRGVIPGKQEDIPSSLTFQVPFQGQPQTADLQKMALEVLLDYPDEIHPVRLYKTDNQPFFEDDFPKTPPDQAAVVQVLVYRVASLEDLRLDHTTWKPVLNPDGCTVNLHLYAQPEHRPHHPHHTQHAYQKLAAAFGLNMTPIRDIELPLPTDPGIPGPGAIDTLALFEFGPALSPPNCDPCVFDNTAP